MKKTAGINVLLLTAYCIPFAFLCVYGDAVWGTMLFYGFMIAGLAVLCKETLKTNCVSLLYIGNALSCASSYTAAKLSGLEPMAYYFKPFTAYSLITALSIVSVIAHMMIVLIRNKRKWG